MIEVLAVVLALAIGLAFVIRRRMADPAVIERVARTEHALHALRRSREVAAVRSRMRADGRVLRRRLDREFRRLNE